MKKYEILESVRVEKLIFGGSGLAVAPDGKKIIISGGAIPESIVDLRILKSKKSHYEAQVVRIVTPSPYDRPIPPEWQIYGGCKWLPIPYEIQLQIKEWQIREAFHHLSTHTTETTWHSITPSPETIGYRNKLEFSWGKYISAREGVHEEFRFGFHIPWQYDRIEDCRHCVLASDRVNAIFQRVDQMSRESGLPTYDPHTREGFWRHLVVRESRSRDETMLVFSVNGVWDESREEVTNQENLVSSRLIRDTFSSMISTLTEAFPEIVSIYFLENTGRADIVTGNPVLLSGKSSITEDLLGYHFEIQPKSFFQTNSRGAEKLYSIVRDLCPESGDILLDLYGGTGTIGMILSDRFQRVYSVEMVESASEDGSRNARENTVENIIFVNKKTEDFLSEFLETVDTTNHPTTLIVDPPRDGMHPKACADLLQFRAETIIYVSCNPATLVRDLQILLDSWEYRLSDIAPMDMFPHTHHIETVVRLKRVRGETKSQVM